MIKGASRRNPVEGRSAQIAGAVAIFAAVGVAAAGGSPTGSWPIDVVLILLATAAAVWAAASAPWWAITLVAVAALGLAPDIALIGVSVIAFGLALTIGVMRVNWAWLRAASVGMSVQVLARLEIRTHFGESAAIGIAITAAIFAIGAWRRPSKIRRRAVRVLGAAAAVAVIGGIGLALGAISARSTVKTANSEAHRGLTLLTSGDVDGARAAFRSAQHSFQLAADNLGKPWTQPSRLLPVLAQNRNSAERLAQAAADASRSIDSILSQLDFGSIKVVNGKIDLKAVAALEQPLTDLSAVLDDLTQTSADASSPWLVGAIQKGLTDLNNDLAKQRTRGDDALRAIRLAPQLLGSEGKRVYFIAFCTPSEARGSLGFMGNFAELTADDGNLEITRFGRTTDDLNPGGDPNNRRITGMDGFLAEWGAFGFNTAPGATAAPDVWQQVTVSPDFPSTAEAIAQLYPQSGGQHVDGVIGLDPAALAALLQFTGPIDVEGSAEPLTQANAERFLLVDQYRTEKATRVDALGAMAQTTIEKLLSGSLPEPRALAKVFGPLARTGHLAVWSQDADEEALFEQFKAGGQVPNLNGGDGFGMSFVNASASKIDSFLRVSARYAPILAADGTASAVATITLTNTAPSSGFPAYVIGNALGFPSGTSRTYFTLYTALTVTGASIDGQPLKLRPGDDRGWHTYSAFINIAPGQAVTLTADLTSQGPLSTGPVLIIAPDLAHAADIQVTGA